MVAKKFGLLKLSSSDSFLLRRRRTVNRPLEKMAKRFGILNPELAAITSHLAKLGATDSEIRKYLKLTEIAQGQVAETSRREAQIKQNDLRLKIIERQKRLLSTKKERK